MTEYKNQEELDLYNAKEKFVSSMIKLSPSSVVKNSPIPSLGVALGSGVVMAVTGLKVAKFMFGGMATVLKILKDFK
ncbi:MAG: hypothetical protein RR272_02530 [Synergistaceae bacterium]